ncbi:AraC family transcriptional regulator [Rathayibacter tanaceti]|uniref:HTH araC/xylS-type domain-containing protein n=1 Tax=Rathayibacter tanaceti TaxID=1671680 RepID=A0AAE6RLS5_9MICO|nr:AraC family transcriptional regulator [Rathayibacter tanaceti]QHC56123.1 hypothetical protein GSU10_11095 [Rathayibacter tanaceti]
MVASSEDQDDGPAAGSGAGVRGVEAVRWFSERGFAFDGSDPRLVCDEAGSPGFRFARIWHTAGVLRRNAPQRRATVLLQLEGAFELTFGPGGRTTTVRAGDVAFVPSGCAFALEQCEPSARMEIECDALALPSSTFEVLADGAVLPIGNATMASVLIACINSALNSGICCTDTGFAEFRLAITGFTAAALTAASIEHRPPRTSRESEHFTRAIMVIGEKVADPDFTVAVLARELQLSEPYLRRIFATHGTTARDEIRLRRAALARMYRADGLGGTPYSADEAARYSGFHDAETMRVTLRRDRRTRNASTEDG